MSLPLLDGAQLGQLGWTAPAPFALLLPDGERLEFTQVLRWLPGRRLAGVAHWGGKTVFAKLFIGDSAARHGAREQQGIAALQAHSLPTPTPLAALTLPGVGFLLLSEFLPDAQTLEADLSNKAALRPAFTLLGHLHAAGLIHDDLHPGNFLCQHGDWCLIDGDGIHPAEVLKQLSNLALFLSQLPICLDAHWDELIAAYGRPVDTAVLPHLVEASRKARLQRFLAKTLRNCTNFAVDRKISRFSVVMRSKAVALGGFLSDPDTVLAQGKILKDGGTCSVAATVFAGLETVVKRYNRKNWRHALSRAWRPSRAWHSWREAHRLAFYGFATPTPLAMIEERYGPLRGRAFLVTEFCPGPNLLDVLSADREPDAAEAEALINLFTGLHRLRITHGDMKATNLLWHAGQVVLIDLDATTQHRAFSKFQRAWRRDRARFLRNWPADSLLHAWLDAHLPTA